MLSARGSSVSSGMLSTCMCAWRAARERAGSAHGGWRVFRQLATPGTASLQADRTDHQTRQHRCVADAGARLVLPPDTAATDMGRAVRRSRRGSGRGVCLIASRGQGRRRAWRMIRRSCVIRVLPAPAISPARILPIRVGPGWRGGAAGAGWEAGAGRSADRWARPGAGCARAGRRWLGHDAVLPRRERGTVPRPGHRCDSGRPGRPCEGMRGANRRPSGQASAAGGRGLTLLRSSPPGWRSPAGAAR